APWTSIQAGIDAAVAGAIVAVASGDYTEDLVVQFKLVRLWGECPASVRVVGTGTGTRPSTLFIGTGASGTEGRRIALSGPLVGVLLSGSEDVIVEETWIHDNLMRGINAQDDLGPT